MKKDPRARSGPFPPNRFFTLHDVEASERAAIRRARSAAERRGNHAAAMAATRELMRLERRRVR